ncbi:MAG: hypothetical protein ACOWWM_01050 [Desulfobacterales bacterium]
MRRKRGWLLLILCALLWAACERRPAVEGEYEAFDPTGDPANLVLRLDAGGKGSWSLEDQYVEIRWRADGDRILMYTQSGGVFEGRVVPVTPPQIHITLENIGYFEFKKLTP